MWGNFFSYLRCISFQSRSQLFKFLAKILIILTITWYFWDRFLLLEVILDVKLYRTFCFETLNRRWRVFKFSFELSFLYVTFYSRLNIDSSFVDLCSILQLQTYFCSYILWKLFFITYNLFAVSYNGIVMLRFYKFKIFTCD